MEPEATSLSILATIPRVSCYKAGYIHYPLSTSDANICTREIQRKFDAIISTFKSMMERVTLTVDKLKELVKIIPDSLLIHFQDIQSVRDFFLRTRCHFTWLDETFLKDLGEHLDYTGPEVDEYKRDLKQYFQERTRSPEEVRPVLPTARDNECQRDRRTLMLLVDDAWDRDMLKDHKCEEICSHIVSILGEEAEHITGYFDNEFLRIYLYTYPVDDS